ncbi:MAG: tRNA threonylcarbamoyladenosine dehydratase [Clostridium sp.]|nr:tRNA threonylcarbamoyladenosine dehydratase [Clostridium sp.]
MASNELFSRTERLLGQEAMEKLQKARVAVFGIGGVGGYVVEALARCGVGALDIIDNDRVSLSNRNRQIIALASTAGLDKVDVMEKRIHEINPECRVTAHNCFFLPETAGEFDFLQYDYVVDAVDTVTAKIAIIRAAKEAGVPVVSSMGTGNKLDPSRFRVSDISVTSIDPLARVMRRELKKRGIEGVKVVWSDEKPVVPLDLGDEALPEGKRSIPGSIAFVPPVAGLILAGEVVRDIAET